MIFGKKKTGIEALKEKLEIANKHMIEAVEHLREAQKIHTEFYQILFQLQEYEQNNTNN